MGNGGFMLEHAVKIYAHSGIWFSSYSAKECDVIGW